MARNSMGQFMAALRKANGMTQQEVADRLLLNRHVRYYGDDVAVIMVSPPDEKGFVSLGVSCDYTKPAADNAKFVIAQVNSRMPFTYGDMLIHVSEIDCFVEAEQELYELQPPHIGDAEMAIGEYCASLIPDGATLSLGIGSIPDAVCRSLGKNKDLGVFSDMFCDGLMELYSQVLFYLQPLTSLS